MHGSSEGLLRSAAALALGLGLAGAAPCSVLIPADDPSIQYWGRVDYSDPKAPRFDWPGVTIKANFRGTGIGVLLSDGHNDYDAFIDGRLKAVIRTDDSTHYAVQGLGPGAHSLVLVKRTEASFGVAGFHGLLLEDGMGLLPPPAWPSHRLEFVGDSLACGAEDEDKESSCEEGHYRPTEDVLASYGPLTAHALGAEFRVIAYSGKGLVRNAGDPSPTSELPLPALFHRVLANVPESDRGPLGWSPDAVVVFLGGNDFIGPVHPDRDQFEGAYRAFLGALRQDYPEARLFCLSFFGQTMEPYVREVVEARHAAGDPGVECVELDYPKAHLTGCFSHPDLEGQRLMAGELSRKLQARLGWRRDAGPGPSWGALVRKAP